MPVIQSQKCITNKSGFLIAEQKPTILCDCRKEYKEHENVIQKTLLSMRGHLFTCLTMHHAQSNSQIYACIQVKQAYQTAKSQALKAYLHDA